MLLVTAVMKYQVLFLTGAAIVKEEGIFVHVTPTVALNPRVSSGCLTWNARRNVEYSDAVNVSKI